MKYNSEQLAKMALGLAEPNSPFIAISDVSVLEERGDQVPKTRHETGYFKENEDYWQQSTNHAISSGYIDENTLVIALTGHGLTIASEMVKRLSSDVFFSMPADSLDEHAQNRIAEQSQTFLAQSSILKNTKPRKGTSTLLVLDAHANHFSDVLSEKNLPDAQMLKEMGFTRIFLAQETEPTGLKNFRGVSTGKEKALFTWLGKLQTDQENWPKASLIQITQDGLDTRPKREREKTQLTNKFYDFKVVKIPGKVKLAAGSLKTTFPLKFSLKPREDSSSHPLHLSGPS